VTFTSNRVDNSIEYEGKFGMTSQPGSISDDYTYEDVCYTKLNVECKYLYDNKY